MNTHWPAGCSFALALSHDVDRVAKRFQFLWYAGQATRRRSSEHLRVLLGSLAALARGDDPYWNFQRIMALEEDLNVRSTFFFLNESGRASLAKPKSMVLFWGRYRIDTPQLRQAIQALDAGAWEVALHGSYHSYLDQELLYQEKERLEAVLGHRVEGVRQHYLRLQIPETWRIHESLGLTYDSTLGYADRVGLRGGKCLPFFPTDPLTGEQIQVLQVPLALMDRPLMRSPDPWSEALRLINAVEAAGGVLTLDWHQRFFNPWEPENHQEMYVRLVKECQRRGAWVVPIGRAVRWWTQRSVGN